jgi:hypothetical protein
MKREKNLETMLVITVGLLVLHVVFKEKNILIGALIIGLIGVFSDFLSDKITWAWLKIAEVMGRISSTILLSVVFFVFLMPIAFLFRLTRKDLLKLKSPEGTVYQERNHLFVAKDLENVW